MSQPSNLFMTNHIRMIKISRVLVEMAPLARNYCRMGCSVVAAFSCRLTQAVDPSIRVLPADEWFRFMVSERAGGRDVGHFEGMGCVPGLDCGGLFGAEFVLGGPHPSRRHVASRGITVRPDEVGVSDQDDPCVSRVGQSVLYVRQQRRRFRHRGINLLACCVNGAATLG